MSTQTESEQLPRCPQCHERIRPDSAFCGNCGASVSHVTDEYDAVGRGDDQATATFSPVSGSIEDDDRERAHESSPWASPSSDYYAPPTTVSPAATDRGSNSSEHYGFAVAADRPDVADAVTVQQRQPQGIRGLLLGILALLLIGAVFGLYLYDAWLSDSARSTVEGWLPWLDG